MQKSPWRDGEVSKMKKTVYQTPKLTVILLAAEDILAESACSEIETDPMFEDE